MDAYTALDHKEMEGLDSSIIGKELEFVIRNFPTEKIPSFIREL